VLGAWGLLVGAVYFGVKGGWGLSVESFFNALPPFYEMTPAGLSRHAGPVLEAVLLSLVWVGAGDALRKWLGDALVWNPLERIALGMGLGAGAWGLGLLALSLVGGFTPLGVRLWTVALAGTAAWGLWRGRGELRSGPRWRWGDLFAGWAVFPAALAVFSLAICAFYALAPEVFYDSLVYHLALPAQFLLAGKWVAFPTNLYGGLPFLVEMIYGGAMAWGGGEAAAKMLHIALASGLCAGVLGWAVREARAAWGWWAAAVFLSTPLVALNLQRAGVEVGMTLWCAGSLLVLSRTLSVPAGDPARGRGMLLAGVLAGLAMGAKYTIWPGMLLLAGAAWASGATRREAGLFLAALALAVSPWIVKNLVMYGNPLFPYFDNVVHPAAAFPVNWRGLHADGWGRDWSHLLGSPRDLARTLAHPWFIAMDGNTDADLTGPLFLWLLPGALLWKAGRGKALAWGLAALWLSWWPLSAMPRFFIPGLLVFCLWAALGLAACPSPAVRRTLAAAALLAALNNVGWTMRISRTFDAWPYLTGRQTRQEYLTDVHMSYPVPYFPAAAWINANTGPGDGVLVVGDARTGYLRRRAASSTVWDADRFRGFLSGAASGAELAGTLRGAGWDYLLLNMGEVLRLKRMTASARDLSVLEDFFRRYAAPVFTDQEPAPNRFRWTIVYRVSTDALAQEAPESPLVEWLRQNQQRNNP
jgi:hypothetical protein